jgi:hypothetical protein
MPPVNKFCFHEKITIQDSVPLSAAQLPKMPASKCGIYLQFSHLLR